MRLTRWLPRMALLMAVMCASFVAIAAQQAGPLAEISGDALLGVIGTGLFLVLAGYGRGLDKRIEASNAAIASLEHEWRQQQTQINLMRGDFQKEHPTQREFVDFRQNIKDRFDRLEAILKAR